MCCETLMISTINNCSGSADPTEPLMNVHVILQSLTYWLEETGCVGPSEHVQNLLQSHSSCFTEEARFPCRSGFLLSTFLVFFLVPLFCCLDLVPSLPAALPGNT